MTTIERGPGGGRRRARPAEPEPARAAFRWPRPTLPVVFAVLAAYLLLQHRGPFAPTLAAADYARFEAARVAGPLALLAPGHALGEGWRPLARELPAWLLPALGLAQARAFLALNLALALAALGGLYALTRSLRGDVAAAFTTAAVAALVLWIRPLDDPGGAEWLGMAAAGLASLLAFTRGRQGLAAVLFAVSVLCHESGMVWAPIAFAYACLVDGDAPLAAFRRVAPMLAVIALRLLAQPAAFAKFTAKPTDLLELAHRPPLATRLALGLRALVNLDQWPAPVGGLGPAVLRGAAGLILVIFVGLVQRAQGADAPARRGLARWGWAWLACGLLPLLVPVSQFQPVLVVVAAMGGWFVLAGPLARRQVLAPAVVTALAVLFALRAATPPPDAAALATRERAGAMFARLHTTLRASPARLPAHSRVFLAGVPGNLGFPDDVSPALRTWYRDATLIGAPFTGYTRRDSAAGETDRFFRYDTTVAWIELVPGPEDAAKAQAANPNYMEDHNLLAGSFRHAEDWALAIREYGKLAELYPEESSFPFNLGGCLIKRGDTADAVPWLRRAAACPNADVRMKRILELFASGHVDPEAVQGTASGLH